MQPNLFNLSDSTWALIDQIGILLGILTSLIPLLGLLWAVFNKERIKRWITRNRFPNVGELTDEELQWDGLIFTVSHAETPLWVIETRLPKTIAMLATEQSQQAAEHIKKIAKQRGIKVLEPVIIKDPDNVKECRWATDRLIVQLKQSCHAVAVDITGGKTPMSLGAFMAAEEMQIASLYVSSKFDKQLNQVNMRSAKLVTVSGGQKQYFQ
jgi:hypothetical protein